MPQVCVVAVAEVDDARCVKLPFFYHVHLQACDRAGAGTAPCNAGQHSWIRALLKIPP